MMGQTIFTPVDMLQVIIIVTTVQYPPIWKMRSKVTKFAYFATNITSTITTASWHQHTKLPANIPYRLRVMAKNVYMRSKVTWGHDRSNHILHQWIAFGLRSLSPSFITIHSTELTYSENEIKGHQICTFRDKKHIKHNDWFLAHSIPSYMRICLTDSAKWPKMYMRSKVTWGHDRSNHIYIIG